MEKKTNRLEVAAILLSCIFVFAMLGFSVYARERDQPQTMVFTVAASEQFKLDWINCTRVTFSEGGGWSFKGLYDFEVGKTYSVAYLGFKYSLRNYAEIVSMQKVD